MWNREERAVKRTCEVTLERRDRVMNSDEVGAGRECAFDLDFC